MTDPLSHGTQALLEPVPVPYLPAAHVLQLVAPELLPVFVTEPGPHVAQACLESVPNFPATHLLQLVAPVLLRVLVTEPAPHVWH